MVREIIMVQVGQAGNQIGSELWKSISKEHGLDVTGSYIGDDPLQLARIGVYFDESHCGRYVPRCNLIDMDSACLESIKALEHGNLFKPENILFGRNSAANNWCKGFYHEGALLADRVKEVMRKQRENCDALQGVQLIHSLGGGTGSGTGSRILNDLADFPQQKKQSFSIYPSASVSDTVVEPYNTILGSKALLEDVELTNIIDNEALYNLTANTLKIRNPTYNDLNRLCTYVISGMTASLRFPGQLSADMKKLIINMVPQPRLHFAICSFAPLSSKANIAYRSLDCADLSKQAFDRKNMMAACDPDSGKYLTAAMVYRGETVSAKATDFEILKIQRDHASQFLSYAVGNPTLHVNNIVSAVCSVPHYGFTRTCTFMGNSTSCTDIYNRILGQFEVMYNKQAFFHWYTNEQAGLADDTNIDQFFSECQTDVDDLVAAYKDLLG